MLYISSYIREHADTIDWTDVCIHASVETLEQLAEDFLDDLKWAEISRRTLSEDFIRKHSNRIVFKVLSSNVNILSYSDQFYKDFGHMIYWDNIWMFRKTSEKFMRKNIEYINWDLISRYQILPRSFRLDFKDKLHWKYIDIIKNNMVDSSYNIEE